MRIVYLANNRTALECLRWLKLEDEIAGLVVHPGGGDALIQESGLPPERVFRADQLRDPATLERIRALDAEIALSVFFGFILKPPFLELFPRGVLNMHPALLPWNRGAYPNVWSIVERTPAGATLHYIDPGVDTGDIVAQRAVTVEPTDTGATLYGRLEQACTELLREAWPAVRAGTASRTPQPPGGTTHRVRDVATIDKIDLDATTTARALIDVLRARTYPPHSGAYFEIDGRRVFLRLQLLSEDEL